MRCALILSMFAASLAHAAWSNYQEVRELTLDAAALQSLQIEAGAGSLQVTGISGADRVHVSARIEVPDASDDEARELIESRLLLRLVRDGDRAVLEGRFADGRRWSGDSPLVHLEVGVPRGLNLAVDDSSGSITVTGVHGELDIRDGSGPLDVTDAVGPVNIDDGSGPVTVDGVQGDLRIVDGSGRIDISTVSGSVTLDDGSGSIDVRGVGGDLIIEDDGSGALNVSRIEGAVRHGR